MTENKKFIPALGYNWLTGLYDFIIKLTMPEKKFRTKLIDEIDPQDGEKILEFGFGTGQNLILLKERNTSVRLIGVDIDPKVRQIAEQKIKKRKLDITLDLYGGKVFPYSDASFDKVYSSLVFHQLDRESKLLCLGEIYRVLKPGGLIIIGDWGQAKSKIMRFAFYAVQILDGFKTTNDNVKGLLPGYIEKAGFKNTRETGYINTKIGTYSYYEAVKYL